MKWKELYSKCNHEVNNIVTKIEQPVFIKSNANNFINKYKWWLLIFLAIFIFLTISTFRFNLQLMLASFGVLLIMFIALIYYNTYKLNINNDELKLEISLKKYSIKIDDIVNIYIERKRNFIMLFIPMPYYYINVLYLENKHVKGFSLSTIMVKKKDIKNFFEHFEFKKIEEL